MSDLPLDYMHARYCNPILGRFWSVDPILGSARFSNPQTWNRYSYALNNPQKYVDPDGEAAETAWDVFNIGLGLVSLADNLVRGNFGSAALDLGGVVLDSGAAVVPFVPGGAGTAIRVSRATKAAGIIKTNAAIGRAFEKAVLSALGIGKAGPKARIPSLSGTARFRVPDALSETALVEIKGGASKLRLSDQIRDFADFAEQTERTFVLVIRKGTEVSDELLKFAKEKGVKLLQAE